MFGFRKHAKNPGSSPQHIPYAPYYISYIYIYCIYIYIYHISGQIITTSLFSLTGIIVVVGDSPRACTTETDSAEKPAAEVANFIHQHVKETNGIFFKILPLTSISILCRHYIYIYICCHHPGKNASSIGSLLRNRHSAVFGTGRCADLGGGEFWTF